jgi:hypothetical protein
MRKITAVRKVNVGRLDWIIRNLEDYSELANELIDLHCESTRSNNPGISFTEVRGREIESRAGLVLDLVEALRIVRRSLTTE